MIIILPLDKIARNMDDRQFNIYLEQLHNGNKTSIDITSAPHFLGINEEELHFDELVVIKGEAYLAGEALIISCHLSTVGKMPCAICNEPVSVEIEVPQFYFAEELSNIRGGIYNFKEAIREAILLEVPLFIECNGKCPRRKDIEKYLRSADDQKEEGYHPFADL